MKLNEIVSDSKECSLLAIYVVEARDHERSTLAGLLLNQNKR